MHSIVLTPFRMHGPHSHSRIQIVVVAFAISDFGKFERISKAQGTAQVLVRSAYVGCTCRYKDSIHGR